MKYYAEKIERLTLELRNEKNVRLSHNSGIGFVTFVSRLQVSRCLDIEDFYDLAMQRLSVDDRTKMQVFNWRIEKAPAQTDLLWENIYKDEGTTRVKSYLLLALLLFVCIILVTPMLLAQKLTPLLNALQDNFGHYKFFGYVLQIVQEHFLSLTTLLFNLFVIPQVIDVISLFEDHKTKSERALSVMKRNFFF